MDFAKKFKEATGSDKLSPFAGHSYDFMVVMEKAVPIALKKAKPGTEAFRLALLDALNTMGRTVISHGVMNWSASDHWGYTNETGVMVVVKNGAFEVLN